MNALAILKEAAELGVQIKLDGGRVLFKATTNAQPKVALLVKLKEHKAEIAALLRRIEPLRAEYRRILSAGPLPDMPARRWQKFQIDAELFLRDWAEQALAIGWTIEEIFGHDTRAPWHRVDKLGFVWVLNGERVVGMGECAAHLVNSHGSQLTYYRLTQGATQ